MLVYSGCELEHWREPFKGDNCGQVFLHYNHVNGPFANKNIFNLKEKEMREIRKKDISMIFQEPMRSLNPVMSIREQLREAYINYKDVNLEHEIIKNLISVGINDAKRVINLYPHQLSGGMKQRVMIAMAIACKPNGL